MQLVQQLQRLVYALGCRPAEVRPFNPNFADRKLDAVKETAVKHATVNLTNGKHRGLQQGWAAASLLAMGI